MINVSILKTTSNWSNSVKVFLPDIWHCWILCHFLVLFHSYTFLATMKFGQAYQEICYIQKKSTRKRANKNQVFSQISFLNFPNWDHIPVYIRLQISCQRYFRPRHMCSLKLWNWYRWRFYWLVMPKDTSTLKYLKFRNEFMITMLFSFHSYCY